ncbi:hypothetical protein, conserved, partial [Eimeria maxima]
VPCQQELLILFWHMLTINNDFLRYICSKTNTNELLVERDFAVRLNEQFTGNYPLDLPSFNGSYADLFCLVVHRVVTDAVL